MKKISILMIFLVLILYVFIGCKNRLPEEISNTDISDTTDIEIPNTDALDTTDLEISDTDDENDRNESIIYNIPSVMGFANITDYSIDKICVTSASTLEKMTFAGEDAMAIIGKIGVISGHSPMSERGIYGTQYHIHCYSNENIVLELSLVSFSTFTEPHYTFSYGKYESVYGFEYGALYTFDSEEHYHELLKLFDEYFVAK